MAGTGKRHTVVESIVAEVKGSNTKEIDTVKITVGVEPSGHEVTFYWEEPHPDGGRQGCEMVLPIEIAARCFEQALKMIEFVRGKDDSW